MEISESVGKMRIVPFHCDSAIKYYYSAFDESLETKLKNTLLSLCIFGPH